MLDSRISANGSHDRTVENMLTAVRRLLSENTEDVRRELSDLKSSQASITALTDVIREMLRMMVKLEAHFFETAGKCLAACEKMAGPMKTQTVIHRGADGEISETLTTRVYEE
jgi:hypothetical protein